MMSQSSYRSPAAIKELRDMGVAALRDRDFFLLRQRSFDYADAVKLQPILIHVAIKKEPHAGCGAD